VFGVRLLTNLGSAVTIYAYVEAAKGLGALRSVMLILLGLALLGVVFADVMKWRKERAKTFQINAPEIADYMYAWLHRGGRAAIFSRDMSWTRDPRIMSLLREKAERHELILCLPRQVEVATALAAHGAELLLYPDLNHTPQSRFTIIGYGRADARVAVGSIVNNRHVIREFQAGHDPFFAVASDLIEIIRSISTGRR
jgi:hypothetical protein